MALTRVRLPAPFGPIRPWIDPFSTSSDTSSTARTPPKGRWTFSSRKSTDLSARPPAGSDGGEAATTEDSLRAEDDDQDQDQAADHTDVVACLLEDVGERRQEQRADDRTEHGAASAEHCKCEDLNGPRHAALVGIDEEVEV